MVIFMLHGRFAIIAGIIIAFAGPALTSSVMTVKADEAMEPALTPSMLAAEDTCQGALANSKQCSLSLRQLRGQQQWEEWDMELEGKIDDDDGFVDDFPYPDLSTAPADYHPSDPDLLQPSPAPVHKFYMYRAIGDWEYPPLNTNTGNLAGVLWYLHHEVVVQYPRKFGIVKILRFLVQTRATKPLFNTGMNFGVRFAFDKGQATGPFICGREHDAANPSSRATTPKFCKGPFDKYTDDILGPHGELYSKAFEWTKYGYFVGCNKLGEFPFPTYPIEYPNATWYSLPGPCPSIRYKNETLDCKEHEPGGYCEGEPTGTGSCTWTYKFAGEISINELVGIKEEDWPYFEIWNKKEYNPYTNKGTMFTWWDDIHSVTKNTERVEKARKLFKEKYPSQPADTDLTEPPCDFNLEAYYKDYFEEPLPPSTTPPPTTTCAEASTVQECFEAATWAKSDGIYSHPDWYPGLSGQSSLADFQRLMWGKNLYSCPRPC